MTKKEKEMYDRQLKELQKVDPEVNIILDVTDEDTNWLKKAREKEKS